MIPLIKTSGKAIAIRLAEDGFDVCINDVAANKAGIEEVNWPISITHTLSSSLADLFRSRPSKKLNPSGANPTGMSQTSPSSPKSRPLLLPRSRNSALSMLWSQTRVSHKWKHSWIWVKTMWGGCLRLMFLEYLTVILRVRSRWSSRVVGGSWLVVQGLSFPYGCI